MTDLETYPTGLEQHHVPLCPVCPSLGHDREGVRTRAYVGPGGQREAQEALLAHMREEHGYGPQSLTPEGYENLQYDARHLGAVTMPRDFAGILTVDDGTIRMLEDWRPETASGMGPIVTAVLIARLRAWADVLEGRHP